MSQDPGWRRVFATLPRLLLPGRHNRTVRHDSAAGSVEDGQLTAIEVMRLLYLAFSITSLLILPVLLIIDPEGPGSISVTTAMIIVGAAALVAYPTLLTLRGRSTTVESPGEVLTRFRTRLLLLIAAAESIVLAGFVMVFLARSPAPYLFSWVVAAPAWYLAAPNRATIDQFQENLGGAVDVLSALTARP